VLISPPPRRTLERVSYFLRVLGVAILLVACLFGVQTVIALGYGELGWAAILASFTAGFTVAGHTVRNRGQATMRARSSSVS
jgi:hypothetical protein